MHKNYGTIRVVTTIEADEAVASSDFLERKREKGENDCKPISTSFNHRPCN